MCIVPDLEAEYKVICKKPILSGATICMNDRCRIKAHRVLEKVPFPKGQIYVLKNKGSVFANPSILSFKLDPEIIDNWEAEPQPLTHWSNQFRMATNNLSKTGEDYVTKEGLLQERNFTRNTNSFKLPNARDLKKIWS